MKKTILFIPFLFASLYFTSCNEQPKKATESKTTTPTAIEAMYRCPMDTEVVSNKPGTCPKCGMDLEKTKK
jgi:hypothetical protein